MEPQPLIEPDAATVRELVDRAAERWADAVFLLAPESGRSRSFAALRHEARRVAARLARLGLGRGDKVALACDNGLAAAELLLGSMYGGFVPVPLNVGAGPRTLASTLAHSDAVVLLASAEHRPLAETLAAAGERRIQVIAVDRDRGLDPSAPDPSAAMLPAVGPDDDALLIYSSGSTGRPKGVLFAQRGILACGWNAVRAHALGPGDRLLCVLPLYHMNAVDKLLGVLASGGSAVVPHRFDVTAFWDWVAAHRCTWLTLVPTLVSQLANRPGPPAATREHVRFARSSAAPLRADQHRAFEARCGIPLLEGMGMTEAGGIFLNPLPPRPRKVGSLGVAHGLEVRIVDEQGRDLPPGQAGEILVRGPSLMRGYYKDAEATAAVLDAAGWLRTGDRGSRDADGYVHHAGRLKELIIKAGTNIAPREVEETLATHAAVRDAAVVGVADAYLGEEIVAYVVLHAGARCREAELLRHCEEALGTLKTPARIEIVAELPRGPSGKVLRQELRERAEASAAPRRATEPAPARGGGVAGGEDGAPRTAIEAFLSRHWADALGCERVGRHEDFFALGGHSLLALRIVSRLRQTFGVEIPLAVFVEAPTIAEQAAIVGDELRRIGATGPDGGDGDLPPGAPLAGADAAEGCGTEPRRAILLAPIRPGCDRPPLFCIYAPGRYRFLARHLGPDQPTYGVFAEQEVDLATPGRRRTSGRARLPSVEELAAWYLEQVRAVQPSGPYHLAGSSFGGRVALEMAQVLRAEGETVGLLAVLDTYMPGAAEWLPLPWFVHHLRRSLRHGPAYVAGAVRGRVGRRARRARAQRGEPAGLDAIGAEARESEFRHQARERHRVRPYAGTVVLFRAMQPIQYSPGYRVDPLLGWRHLARGGLEVHDVPGSHLGMLREPHAAHLADKIRPYLRPR